jgi:hypothetical protein
VVLPFVHFYRTKRAGKFCKKIKYLLFLPFCHFTTFIALKLNQILPDQNLIGGFSITLPFHHFYCIQNRTKFYQSKNSFSQSGMIFHQALLPQSWSLEVAHHHQHCHLEQLIDKVRLFDNNKKNILKIETG